MRVTMETYGGYAAAIRRAPIVVEAAALPPGAAAEFERLVAAARAEPAPPADDAGRLRDAMSYTITIADDDGEAVLSADDGAMSPAFAELRRWLQRHAAEH